MLKNIRAENSPSIDLLKWKLYTTNHIYLKAENVDPSPYIHPSWCNVSPMVLVICA
jgi:hypothetical protein